MQWLPPGAAEEESSPPAARRCSSKRSTALPDGRPQTGGVQDIKNFHTDIWELISGEWKVTHQFNAGLELNSRSASKAPAASRRGSRVHLPSTSLRSLQQLRGMFERPGSVAWDVSPASEYCHAVFSTLLEHVGEAVTSENKVEAISTLRTRAAHAMPTCDDVVRTLSEDLLAPEQGAEAVDISICPLNSFGGATPEVSLTRLATPVDFGAHQKAPVRYAMLVLCASSKNNIQLAREVARAFAGAVMDEDFARAIGSGLVPGDAEGLLHAFEAYLSNVTIMPAVYLKKADEGNADQAAPASDQECLLADSIVDGIEKLICESRHLPQSDLEDARKERRSAAAATQDAAQEGMRVRRNSLDSITRERRQRFYIDVSLVKPGGEWRTTRQLMQGLEIDATANRPRPHLPHVSVTALTRARQMLTPECVGLGVEAASLEAIVEALVKQLCLAGLPMLATSELTEALTRFIVHGDIGLAAGRLKSLGRDAFNNVLEPTGIEEACHVIGVTCKHFPASHAPVGAYVRIKLPLIVQLPSAKVNARFFFIIVGNEAAEPELASIADSVAAIATDEDLIRDLDSAGFSEAFIRAFDFRLDNLTIVPHTRLSGKISATASDNGERNIVIDIPEDAEEGPMGARAMLEMVTRVMQKYSVPLITGVSTALIWSNVHIDSFKHFTTDAMIPGAEVFGHPLSLKFIINDIFMCFFFGLAVKEVTEAVLPGGSLSPLKRAVNPLMATVGGIVGPAVAYIVLVLVLWAAGTFEGKMCDSAAASSGGHRRLAASVVAAAGGSGSLEPCTLGLLINGWGVPTATDISLAWMFALLIFGSGHPSINFLLLLAIVDDAIGMGIIAICYPDPANPVEPLWLLLVLAAIIISFVLRKLKVPYWQPYIALAGPFSWIGLLKAHVHPALAFVFVVPLMPASHAVAARPGVCDLGAVEEISPKSPKARAEQVGMHLDVSDEQRSAAEATAAAILARYHSEEAPLHRFEHHLKMPVDFGMLFFGLCNAGVKLNSVGGITASVVFALIVGKTLGIAAFGLLAVRLGFGLPPGVTLADLFAMSMVGGVGLTVALFVANEAFVDLELQGQAKFGAVLSVLAAPLAWLLKVTADRLFYADQVDEVEPCEAMNLNVVPCPDGKNSGAADADLIEDCLVDEILQTLWVQRRYAMRGAQLSPLSAMGTPVNGVGRTSSKNSVGPMRSWNTNGGMRCRTPMGGEARPLW